MSVEGMPGSIEEMQMQQQQQAANAERRKMILDQILAPAARERLARLSIVRPDKARATEDALITGAQNGRIKQVLDEAALIALLEQFGGSSSADGPVGTGKKGVVIQRRKYGFDNDEDDDDDSDLL